MSLISRLSKVIGFASGSTSGYDAAKTTSRKRQPSNNLGAEDTILKNSDRRLVVASARDVRRNFAVARWAINKHLDFVVSHNFRSRSGDRDFDRRLEKFVERICEADKFDVSGRHPHRRFMRMMEAARTVDGDILAVKVSGGYLQAIEGDRIRDGGFKTGTDETWVHGLKIGSAGEVSKFAIHKRTGQNQFEFERIVTAPRAIWFGYFDRFDQYRGVPLITSAINTLLGLYDGFDYALAKSKIAQLFALSIYRQAETDWGGGVGDEDDENSSGSATKDYNIDFSKGPIFLDLNDGERAEFLESNSPGTATAEFWQTLISVSLKSLDIPFSFYDEAYTNFFGAKSALILYQKSAKEKQRDVREFNNKWLKWRLSLAILDGEFEAPVGYDPGAMLWQWIPEGVPWWNPKDEISANIAAIEAGLKTRSEVRTEAYGDDWRDVIDELAEEKKYMDERGIVPVSNNTANQAAQQEPQNDGQ
jgi:capsid protein